MPINSTVIPDLNLVISVVIGMVDDQITYEHEKAIATLPDFKPTMNQIADAREVSENLLTQSGLVRISEVTPFAASAKRTYVVNSEMAKVYSVIFATTSGGHDNYFVTYHLEEACQWLNVPINQIQNCNIYSVDTL